MTRLSLFDAIEIKKILKEKFDCSGVHFHDACPNQYFSFEKMAPPEMQTFITEFFKNRKQKAVFSDNKLELYVKE